MYAQDKQGSTALHLAARHGEATVIKLLLATKNCTAAAAAADKAGQVPLHLAAAGGHVASAQNLSITWPEAAIVIDTQGYSPTAWAAKRGHAAELPVRRQVKSCWDALLLTAGALGRGMRERGKKIWARGVQCTYRMY